MYFMYHMLLCIIKCNFSHDKNKPLFDQVKYDEQKSSDDNF